MDLVSSILMWIGVALLFVVVVIIMDGLVSRPFMRSTIYDGAAPEPRTYAFDENNTKGRVLVVYLPGILARTADKPWFFYDALESGFDGYNVDVLPIDYRGNCFHWKRIVTQIVDVVSVFVHHYDKIVVVGESLDGRLVNAVFHEAKKTEPMEKFTRPLLIDPPLNGASFGGGGNIAAAVLRWLPIGMLVNKLRLADKMFTQPSGLPSPENIGNGFDFFHFSRGVADTYDDYVEYVRENAKVGLTGHYLSVWRDQLVAMAVMPWYDDAFVDHPPLYIACSEKDCNWQVFTEDVLENDDSSPLERPQNVTIKQFKSLGQWQVKEPALRSYANVAVVRSTHCGYGERPVAWTNALTSMLARVIT